jgi:hypothetical protein
MPDSLPLVRKPRPGDRGAFPDRTGLEARVSANSEIVGARHLDALPRDVDRLLERHGTSLPRYLDAQRWRDIAASHARWPLLWTRQPNLPGESS